MKRYQVTFTETIIKSTVEYFDASNEHDARLRAHEWMKGPSYNDEMASLGPDSTETEIEIIEQK